MAMNSAHARTRTTRSGLALYCTRSFTIAGCPAYAAMLRGLISDEALAPLTRFGSAPHSSSTRAASTRPAPAARISAVRWSEPVTRSTWAPLCNSRRHTSACPCSAASASAVSPANSAPPFADEPPPPLPALALDRAGMGLFVSAATPPAQIANESAQVH